MNVEETRERLSCYRPGIDDPADPLFAAALAAAQRDPALAEWNREQQELDAVLRGHLQQASVPDGLMQRLQGKVRQPVARFELPNAAAEAGRAAGAECGEVIRPGLWGRVAAAAAVLLLGIMMFHALHRPASAVESFRGDMAKLAMNGFPLDHEDGDMLRLRTWLARARAPVYDDCPPCIDANKGIGCRKFTWNDRTVSVVCFEKDSGRVVHLFVIERAALDGARDLPDDGRLAAKQHEGLENGGWTDGRNVYLLVGSSSDVSVSDLF